MDGMRDPYPALSPGELTALRRIGGGLGKYAQLYHAYTLVALELVAFDPEGRLVATEAGHQWLHTATSPSSGRVASYHAPSSAASTTNTAESNIRYTPAWD
jgi:hypothetical protein